MVAPQQQLVLTIDKPAAGGRMIARADGRVVFVAGAIPGERVVARVERVAKGTVYADTVAVEEASPDRRSHAGDPRCGGSLYSHISYSRQLQLKGEVIADAFARIGRVQLAAPIRVASSKEEGYRMRARLHVRGYRCGFFREATHDLCDARQTGQLLPETCDAIDRVMARMKSLGIDSVREIDLAENVDATERVVHFEPAARTSSAGNGDRVNSALTSVEGLTSGPYVKDVLVVGARRLELRRHVLAFFQGNRYLLRDLVGHVSQQVRFGSTALDLYAGTGLFSVAAAVLRGARMEAVEADRVAGEDLGVNAVLCGGNLTTVRARVEDYLTRTRRSVETIIVDPPRTGMSRDALDGALGLRALRLVYVSCDVPTLARDAGRIVAAGYAIEQVDGFDLFPNTPHVETVVVFQRLG